MSKKITKYISPIILLTGCALLYSVYRKPLQTYAISIAIKMPRRKQPKLLTQLSLETLRQLMRKLIIIINNDVGKKNDVIAFIRETMLSLPQSVGEVISKEFLNVIQDRSSFDLMTTFSCGILDELITATLHPKMKYLDVCKESLLLGRAIWMSLPNLKYLESLSIGRTTFYNIPNPVNFSNRLVILICHFECTSQMIEELALTCHSLCKLDVKNSVHVLDPSVDTLLCLKNLCILQVRGTGLTADGCIKLLYKLPKLHKFESDFSLQSLMKMANLDVFPQLTEVWLNNPLITIYPLHNMQNLTKLCIYNGDYEHIEFSRLLALHGMKLRSLELANMKGVCIIDIINECPNLKQLLLSFCTFQNVPQDYLWDRSLPHFTSVEELTVVNNFWFLNYPVIYYSNLHYIMCSKSINFTDIQLNEALSQGWLKYAHIIRFRNCNLLSMHALSILIERCNELEMVGDIMTWNGIDRMQYILTAIHYKVNNIDITIL